MTERTSEVITHIGNRECKHCGETRPQPLVLYYHELSFEDGIEHYICLDCVQEIASRADYDAYMNDPRNEHPDPPYQ